jgi:large subunit ribosomal protein L17
MRHAYFGKKLSRTKNERRRLFQIMSRDMFIHGKIKTTLAKAKAVQPLIEKLITNAKKGTRAGVNEVRKVLADKKSVSLLLNDVTTRFSSRKSGYTRIIKLGNERSDASEMALLSFVDDRVVAETVTEKKPVNPKEIKKEKVKEVKAEKAVKKVLPKVRKIPKK